MVTVRQFELDSPFRHCIGLTKAKAQATLSPRMSDEDLAARRAIADETLENLLQPGMSTETFLNEYWEKKPVFIHRNKPVRL